MLHAIAFAFAEKSLEIAATVFLVLVVVGSALIGPHNKLPGRNDAPLPMKSLGKMPILQVELARNEKDLERVFTPGNLERNVQDARIGNSLDTFLFIPSYAGLLISIGLILARGDDRWRVMLILVTLVAVPLAAVCDWTENSGISKVLDKLAVGKPLVDTDATRISTPSFIKWTTLGLVLLIYGVAAARRLGIWNWPLAIIAVTGLGLGTILLTTLFRYLLERYRPQP
jgi:hypothetical protein